MSNLVRIVAGAARPVLCRDCAHFRQGPAPKCAKFTSINVVTGEVKLDYAETARQFECKGAMFEPRPSNALAAIRQRLGL